MLGLPHVVVHQLHIFLFLMLNRIMVVIQIIHFVGSLVPLP